MKYIILFSGYNQRAVIAFLRTLAKNKIENYMILAASAGDDILKTDYAPYVYGIRKRRQLEYEEIKKLICKAKTELGFEEFLIPPVTEALNRFLLKFEQDFADLGNIDSLVSADLYERISDKIQFSDFCLKNGILVPEEIEFPKKFQEAFVAKPLHYFDKKGNVYTPVLIQSEAAYQNFLMEYPKEAFFYQRYIDGRSLYLLYYFPRNLESMPVMKFSQENFMQQPKGKSILVAKPGEFHRLFVAKQFEKAFIKAGYYGFVMVELRLDGDLAYMIEANPRFWGPSQLFVDAGCNFFEYYLMEYGFLGGQALREDAIDMHAVYFWHGGSVPEKKEETPVFYNGYQQQYLHEFSELCKWDVYRREDTKQLFLEYR